MFFSGKKIKSLFVQLWSLVQFKFKDQFRSRLKKFSYDPKNRRMPSDFKNGFQLSELPAEMVFWLSILKLS